MRRKKFSTKDFKEQITRAFQKAFISAHARTRYQEDSVKDAPPIEQILRDAEYVSKTNDCYKFRTGSWHFLFKHDGLYEVGTIVTCMHRDAKRRVDINKAF